MHYSYNVRNHNNAVELRNKNNVWHKSWDRADEGVAGLATWLPSDAMYA